MPSSSSHSMVQLLAPPDDWIDEYKHNNGRATKEACATATWRSSLWCSLASSQCAILLRPATECALLSTIWG